MHRRTALKTLIASCTLPAISKATAKQQTPAAVGIKYAIQQYSFNHQLRSGELKIEDFPKTAVNGTGIKALEYFNGHFEDRSGDEAFFRDLRRRTDDLGAVNTMMLCRSTDALDSPDASERKRAVEGYRPWLEGTKILGGQCIRVDVRQKGDAEKQKQYATLGLEAVCKAASEYDLDILVENHGNYSSNGTWLADVMQRVEAKNCGTLPDFQNFTDYDPYKGVQEMMPWAKIVCAKSKKFDAQGNEVNVDFHRMLKIVLDAKFTGYIGIEFEGHDTDPVDGINATRRLLDKVIAELTTSKN